jgi:hypothetical protein
MYIGGKTLEDKIQEAMARGEFDNLPGAGKPIDLNDDIFVPNEMKMAYRVLKNADMVPQEVTLMNEISVLNQKLQSENLSEEQSQEIKKQIAFKQSVLNMNIERMQRQK